MGLPRKIMKKREILLEALLKQEIAEEFNTTTQTVREALKYNNNSALGRRIRKKAKELLEKEAKNIEDFE